MFVPNMQFYRPCPQMFFNFQTAQFINVFFLINCPAIRYCLYRVVGMCVLSFQDEDDEEDDR